MAQLFFYRYVDDFENGLIENNRKIEPGPHQVCKYYTPDRYETGADARTFLSLTYVPTFRVGPIPADETPDFNHVALRVVAPADGQPGGGLEAATTHTLYLFEIAAI